MTASALAAVGVLVGVAAGQPPAAPPRAPADPTDALIQKALANDPDVQVARAKLALAEAEVAKARQAAVSRVLALRDGIEQQKMELGHLLGHQKMHEAMMKSGRPPTEDPATTQIKITAAKGALARAETELRLLTGDGPKVAAKEYGAGLMSGEALAALLAAEGKAEDPSAIARWNDLVRRVAARPATGPIPDRIRASLDKIVRLDGNIAGMTIDSALQVFRKDAGLDVPVRRSSFPPAALSLDHPPGGVDLPVGAWFQMFQDSPSNKTGVTVYVRDYGLLLTEPKNAPPDAVTLTEFWRTARPVAATKQPDPPAATAVKWREYPHDKLPPVLKAKAGEAIAIPLPVKAADVDENKLGTDNPAITPQMEVVNGGVVVVIRSERAGKARVSWNVTDATGRRFSHPGLPVEFE